MTYRWPVFEGYVWNSRLPDDCASFGGLYLWRNSARGDNWTNNKNPDVFGNPYQGYWFASHQQAAGPS